jgi:hypothetical protein
MPQREQSLADGVYINSRTFTFEVITMLILKILFKLAIGFLSFRCLAQLTFILMPWELQETALMAASLIWLVPLTVLEIICLLSNKNPLPKVTTHLRYAPIAVVCFFGAAMIVSDQAMVQYSKYQIRSYVYGHAPGDDVQLDLHNTDRGWCGNGQSATLYSLYGDTAAEGFASPDSDIRARSTRMSLRVYDWLNGTCGGPFPDLIRQAETDADPFVRGMAQKFLKDRHNFCRLNHHL